MKVRYCEGCKREVKAEKKKYKWAFAIVGGLLSFGIIFLVYSINHVFFRKRNKCSMCGMKVIKISKAEKLGYYNPVTATVDGGGDVRQ